MERRRPVISGWSFDSGIPAAAEARGGTLR
jgi:hypothetical protein